MKILFIFRCQFLFIGIAIVNMALFHRSLARMKLRVSMSNSIAKDSDVITKNFITNIIDDDIRENRNGGRVLTRFPPEPNGYLHLGHAKSICLNFGVSKAYGGTTNMRFDDTNPEKENMEYINSILEDVKWLVNDQTKEVPWDGDIRHASDYFDVIYQSAVYLIKNGLAYVENLSQEEMRAYRGTLTEPGKDSPYRNRSVEENLQLFEEMKIGKFPDGHCVLRAKIDNTSPNMNMRDPTLYRIKHSVHPITGNKWCIYPMYDFAHALSDAIEGITHSLCTLEFADHRPLYDWTIDQIIPSGLLPFKNEKWRPTQIEFSRLNLQYTVLSKRKLIQLVTNNHVEGWNDPRMPTISGLRRRGYPANSIKLFCDRIGISRAENNIEMEVFEETIREYLDAEAPRIFAIINPLKLTITNWPTDMIESFNIENHPKRPDYGNREISFTNEIYIDKADFFDTGIDGKTPPPKGYKRLVPDGTVRLKYGYVIKCDKVIRDASTHEVLELQCSYDKDSASGSAPTAMKKPKGIIQWLSKQYARPIKMHEYDRLFLTPNPGKDQPDGDFIQDLNPNSKTVITTALIENSIMQWKYGSVFQFERVGYFYLDPVSNGKQMTDRVSDSQVNTLVFNRVVTLKDTWQQTMTDEDSSVSTSSSQQQKGSPPKASVDTKFANFYKLDLRVGEIVEVANHPDADSLYVSKINLGDESGPRTVVSGLVKYFQPSELLGKKVLVLCNLKPSKLRGILSEGMVLTAVIPSDDGSNNSKIELIQPTKESVAGESIILPAEYKAPAPPAAENAKSNLSKDVWTKIAVNLKINSNKMLSFDDATLTTTTGSPLVTTTFVDTIIQ